MNPISPWPWLEKTVLLGLLVIIALSAGITLAGVLNHIPTFKERWQPVIDHPLKSLSLIRALDHQSFCPIAWWGNCRIA